MASRSLMAQPLHPCWRARSHDAVPHSARAGFYRVGVLDDGCARRVRFSISVPRSSAMWSALERIDEDAWMPADGLKDAASARTSYTPSGKVSRGA